MITPCHEIRSIIGEHSDAMLLRTYLSFAKILQSKISTLDGLQVPSTGTYPTLSSQRRVIWVGRLQILRQAESTINDDPRPARLDASPIDLSLSPVLRVIGKTFKHTHSDRGLDSVRTDEDVARRG